MAQKPLFLVERLFGLSAFGDVAGQRQDQALAGGFQAVQAYFHGKSAAVLSPMDALDIDRIISGWPFPRMRRIVFQLEANVNVEHDHSEQLFPRVTQLFASPLIYVENPSFLVVQVESVGGIFHQYAKSLFADL